MDIATLVEGLIIHSPTYAGICIALIVLWQWKTEQQEMIDQLRDEVRENRNKLEDCLSQDED